MNDARPLSVTIISWYLIIISVFGILGLSSAGSIPFSHAMIKDSVLANNMFIVSGLLNVAISIAAGIGMLKRKNRARLLYFYGTPIVMLVGLFIYNSSYFLFFTPIGLIFYLVLFYFLTRKPVLHYFVENPLESAPPFVNPSPFLEKEKPDVVRRLVGVLSLVVGGSILNGWLMMTQMLFENLATFIVGSLFLFVPSSAFVLFGLWLWGWKRWLSVLGFFLVATGAFSIMTGYMLHLFTSPNMKAMFANIDTTKFGEISDSAIINGIVVALVGAAMLSFHYFKTRQQLTRHQVS